MNGKESYERKETITMQSMIAEDNWVKDLLRNLDTGKSTGQGGAYEDA